MQTIKANAPWRTSKQVAQEVGEESACAISREVFLAARTLMQETRSQPDEQYRLRGVSSSIVQAALGASSLCSPPPGLEMPEPLDSDVSTATSDNDSLPQEDIPSDVASDIQSANLEEYQVLLQNLPKALLKESALRVMVKEAKLKDVKKLVFRSDGRALITLTSYGALCQCIDHFNGLPWFHAPTCRVPSITATHVLSGKSSKSVAQDVATQQPASNLSADAPVFVPGANLSADAPVFVPGANLSADASVFVPGATLKASILAASTDKMRGYRRCLSHASTDSGSSSDEASCGSDSEMETPLVCA